MPHTYSICFQTQLSAFFQTSVQFHLCHTLDDFLIIEPPSLFPPHNQICQQHIYSMLLSCKTLNIPIVADKAVGPSRVIEFMGIVLDSDKMKAQLPPDKVKCIVELLSS